MSSLYSIYYKTAKNAPGSRFYGAGARFDVVFA